MFYRFVFWKVTKFSQGSKDVRKTLLALTFFLFTSIWMISCTSEVVDDAPTVQTPVSPLSPIPTPVSEEANASSESAGNQIEVPEPETGFGTVGGILTARTPSSGSNYITLPITPIYLAPIIKDDEGNTSFAGLDFSKDPTATTNQTGVFIINKVPAGQYGFVVMRGVKPYLIKNEQGEDYVVTVEAGEALNLGEVRTELPDL